MPDSSSRRSAQNKGDMFDVTAIGITNSDQALNFLANHPQAKGKLRVSVERVLDGHVQSPTPES
ncbi:MAG: hypothetical protein HYW51_01345 [Candidatus Doudnabacteria bacterium]|nr:hypothetical protein [Candidatus Doudnabacteria bacterium]